MLHQLWIAQITFRGGDIFNPMVFPQPILIAKSPDPGFGGNPGASQYDNLADMLMLHSFTP